MCHVPRHGFGSTGLRQGCPAPSSCRSSIPAVLEERTDLVPEFVKVIVRQGVSFMPQLRKTEISDADLEALAAYLARNGGAR